jgi:RNA polymerase sigma-70 factor, ECF subfamily
LRAPKHEVDERLLVEAAKRDPARFAELYEHNVYKVYAYVSRRVALRHEAEDITSDVFHHAFEHLKTYEWRGTPFIAWLIRIAAHRIVDRWRSASRELGNPAADDAQNFGMEEIVERAALFQLVKRLPHDQRRVLVARFIEEKSIREIAQELGRSEGAIKQLQFRALEKLRASMEGANG